MSGNSGKQPTDCPSNLKEAIDWILRVTGKDGQGRRDNTRALAEAVKELLEGASGELTLVIGKNHGNARELTTLKDGLERAVTWVEKDGKLSYNLGPIGRLANGLAEFIGYKNINSSFASGTDDWRITGAGIAPSNMATHRLCDAAIAFTIGVLEGCKRNQNIKTNKTNLDGVDNVISALHGIYGTGTHGLVGVAGTVKSELSMIKGSSVTVLVSSMGSLFNSLGNDIKTLGNNATGLADKVGEYINNIINSSGSTSWTMTTGGGQIGTALKKFVSSDGTYDPNKFKSSGINDAFKTKGSYSVKSALALGTNAFITHLKAKYESAYQATTATWQQKHAEQCAKIFLGCLPLLFNGLSYLYWNCRNGGWNAVPLGEGSFQDFMYSMAYGSSILSVGKTGNVVSTAFEKFEEFQKGLERAAQARQSTTAPVSSATTTAKATYSEFLSALKQKWTESWADTPLSALYHCASCYFKCLQIKNSNNTNTSPSTIRQMLYFLAALPFSSEFGGCERHIGNLLSKPFPISIAGLKSTTPRPLTADNINTHLTITTSLFSARILGLLQGLGDSKEKSGEPWLYHLFCNGLQLRYPSGSELFNAVYDYIYAVQFQLYFLYRQCSVTYTQGCGWRDCRFGNGINGFTNAAQSHICQGYKCGNSGSTCDHKKSGTCKHNDYSNGESCGKTSYSPLQAFLTDKLDGFHVSLQPTPYSPNHLENHPRGSMCHVKMGFNGKLRDDSVPYNGRSIMLTLNYICADVGSPFRRIYENLLCLTKRTPRTLGEFFGFYWQFVVLLNSDVSNATKQFFAPAFLEESFGSSESRSSILAISNLNGSLSSHNSFLSNGVGHADLLSLYYPDCGGRRCGPYLYPLGYSFGATFSPKFASTYISWLVYLADDFGDWLSEFLERFDGLKCEGCGNHCGSHSASKHHGKENACHCPTITQCADVLPLYYEYGFTILDPIKMNGWKWDQTKRQWQSDTSIKRSCNAFHSQLQTVITGNPLNKFLESIDAFLYAIRRKFFSKISGFWTIYVCLILYTFFFLLDTLHLRSHFKLTSSHVVPPLALLTSGKPLPITKLMYITQ
ncbi:uncharacterized protein BcabD6B2_17280 [Babesia caballi]|uniref:Variant erythrocyte surface antigen-1, beta subunit n=1 Tax=Babesia caballi TaxID=5871 RepID=A0AAV4LQ55_BABCB|nr:hypothetical protein, conserved [Babesia caballi]